MNPADVVVAARDATRTYPMPAGDVHALRGVTLDVAAGDWLALMGPSGCAKSHIRRASPRRCARRAGEACGAPARRARGCG